MGEEHGRVKRALCAKRVLAECPSEDLKPQRIGHECG